MFNYQQTNQVPASRMMDYQTVQHHQQNYSENTVVNNMFPRSQSEANGDNNCNKFRQLPCRTFISVGTCPYRERCVYLHDPRAICREAKTKTRRKNKEDNGLDTIFWPIMPHSSIMSKLDSNRQPHVIQQYYVPPPSNLANNIPPNVVDPYRRHDQAVYSMWMHFVDFCMSCTDTTNKINNGNLGINDIRSGNIPSFQAPDLTINSYTKCSRLPVFRQLSSGRSIGTDTNNVTVVTQPVTYQRDTPRVVLNNSHPKIVTNNYPLADYPSDNDNSEGTSGESDDEHHHNIKPKSIRIRDICSNKKYYVANDEDSQDYETNSSNASLDQIVV